MRLNDDYYRLMRFLTGEPEQASHANMTLLKDGVGVDEIEAANRGTTYM